MEITQPTSQILELQWKPELRVVDRRNDVIRDLQANHHLESFKLDTSDFAARLPHSTELSFSLHKGALSVVSSAARVEDGIRAFTSALDLIQPIEVFLVRTWFTHVVPLPGDYDELRRTSGVGLLPWWPSDISDWSVLIDGSSRSSRTRFLCEFGIVSKAEIPARVAREVGRTGGPSTQAGFFATMLDLPAVALFVDSTWSRAGRLPGLTEASRIASEFLSTVTAEANELAEDLRKAVSGQAGREEVRFR